MPPSTVSAKLGVAPLLRCRAKTADLIQTTEAERLVGERIGQQIFRDALLEYGRPPPDHRHHRSRPARDSHLVPWAECEDALRHDVHDAVQFRC
jgi:hypothetical protein